MRDPSARSQYAGTRIANKSGELGNARSPKSTVDNRLGMSSAWASSRKLSGVIPSSATSLKRGSSTTVSEKSLLHSKTFRRGPALAGKLADKLSASLSASLSAWNQCGLESVKWNQYELEPL